MEEKKIPYVEEEYDVVVVGAGHAGCEAALACARLGLETIIFTVSVDSIAMMPCNPNIGGSSKGHLVREIDALGGEMGKNIDKTFIQSKMLNKSTDLLSIRAGVPVLKRNISIPCSFRESVRWFAACRPFGPVYVIISPVRHLAQR